MLTVQLNHDGWVALRVFDLNDSVADPVENGKGLFIVKYRKGENGCEDKKEDNKT